jgi:hypothetical protein
MTLPFGDFVHGVIETQASEMGVSPEDYVVFSVLYYAADVDSHRIARRLNPDPHHDI